MIEKEYPVEIKSLTEIQDFLNDWCEQNSVSIKVATKIAVCADELVSNVVYYSGASSLCMQCSFENDVASISFIDDGKSFNPLTDSAEPDIDASASERKIGGLGIHMVKKMMDGVEYVRDGKKNILTIRIKNGV